ncbi:MAG: YfiR family protein [Sulfuricella sp.]|nr:YfiR family protein [Sulfuricella sp.]
MSVFAFRRSRIAAQLLPCLAAALLGGWPAVGFAADPVKEYNIKAVFIYNFAKFVDWPDSSGANVHLCLLGASPFGKAFDTIKGQPVKDRKFDVTAIDAPTAVAGCQMIYVPPSQERNLDKVLARARGNGILVVSDSEGFAQRGSMINLYIEDEKVRFEINLPAIESSGLKVSSKLLALGKAPNS